MPLFHSWSSPMTSNSVPYLILFYAIHRVHFKCHPPGLLRNLRYQLLIPLAWLQFSVFVIKKAISRIGGTKRRSKSAVKTTARPLMLCLWYQLQMKWWETYWNWLFFGILLSIRYIIYPSYIFSPYLDLRLLHFTLRVLFCLPSGYIIIQLSSNDEIIPQIWKFK